ncbi:uncharacterized protein LOC143059328 [Mytilus galloprovincialis]|uniref:uncharacterized protein LOC143059328 n=1 Tax=Mytilus galloprovincialis TaxID=29158 RepID=UPI003F7CB435
MYVLNTRSVYTRWGRKDCPLNETELIYTGIVGGGYYTHKGAPSNYVCLPHDPDFIHGDKIQFPSEYLEGGSANQNRKLLFAVVARFGTLPCPPYYNNVRITCVVCSRL